MPKQQNLPNKGGNPNARATPANLTPEQQFALTRLETTNLPKKQWAKLSKKDYAVLDTMPLNDNQAKLLLKRARSQPAKATTAVPKGTSIDKVAPKSTTVPPTKPVLPPKAPAPAQSVTPPVARSFTQAKLPSDITKEFSEGTLMKLRSVRKKTNLALARGDDAAIDTIAEQIATVARSYPSEQQRINAMWVLTHRVTHANKQHVKNLDGYGNDLYGRVLGFLEAGVKKK